MYVVIILPLNRAIFQKKKTMAYMKTEVGSSFLVTPVTATNTEKCYNFITLVANDET